MVLPNWKASAKQMEDRKKWSAIPWRGVRGDLYEHSVPGGGDGMALPMDNVHMGCCGSYEPVGFKIKGRNGEKISIINTMGNGQDWVTTASSLGGNRLHTRTGAIVSFVGGTYGTPADYGHVAL